MSKSQPSSGTRRRPPGMVSRRRRLLASVAGLWLGLVASAVIASPASASLSCGAEKPDWGMYVAACGDVTAPGWVDAWMQVRNPESGMKCIDVEWGQSVNGGSVRWIQHPGYRCFTRGTRFLQLGRIGCNRGNDIRVVVHTAAPVDHGWQPGSFAPPRACP